MSQERKKIFVVDDHPVVRHGLLELIRQEPDLVVSGEAGDPLQALDTFAQDCPDVVILDLSSIQNDAAEFIETLRGRYPGLAVLVLTMHEEAWFAERALCGGAQGYLTKQEASEKVLAAIRSLLDGEMYVSDRVSRKLFRRLLGGNSRRGDGLVGRLSARERQVFSAIGHGKTTRDIARELDLSVKTIETHREQIIAKLCLDSSRELIRYAVRWVLDRQRSNPAPDS